jgi:hypothetical protein
MEKKKFSTLPGLKIQPSVIQSVVSRYTDCTIRVPTIDGGSDFIPESDTDDTSKGYAPHTTSPAANPVSDSEEDDHGYG